VIRANNHSPHVWPAEWETQTATWIAWPHNRATWHDRFVTIPGTFARFIHEVSQVQPVQVLTGRSSLPQPARDFLRDLPNVLLHEIATNDCWIRDYGPTFVRRSDDGALVGINWHYNAWGGKWPPFDEDAKVGAAICQAISCLRSASPLYCEGGALETDGQGTLMTTSSVLLSPTRNPGWSREMVEGELKRQLGVTRIIWVDGGGLQGDDTDGHIDQLARFIRPGVVVAATSSTINDPNYSGLAENLRILRRSLNAKDEKLEVHALPTPPPRAVLQKRLPESYCNFLFANGIVLVPTFRHDPSDQAALRIFEQLIPERRIVPLDASDLIWGLGAFHCASQQQPSTSSPVTP
jgi:agmatine deiminase